MKLSDYVENKSIKKIDLIKIDIEMHEPEAIEGLGYYLQKFKPIVIVEVLSEKVAGKLNKLINNREYVIFHLNDNNDAQLVEKFSLKPRLWNYLFFHHDLIEKVKLNTSIYKEH